MTYRLKHMFLHALGKSLQENLTTGTVAHAVGVALRAKAEVVPFVDGSQSFR